MCSVPAVGPWEASGLFQSLALRAAVVGEAKEQWLSALMPTTAMCIREQQNGQAVCTNSLLTL